MEFLIKRRVWLGLLIVVPFLMANKQCQRSTTWGDPYTSLSAAWEQDHQDIDKYTTCADCHDGLSKTVKPKSHDATWIQVHGKYSNLKYGFRSQNVCALCHQESQCATCHQQQQPTDHTAFWRLRGHGLMVGLNRQKCATCHQVDFCERCHANTKPLDHTASWGAPAQRHCFGCHAPIDSVKGQKCFVCHQSTPSHPTLGLP